MTTKCGSCGTTASSATVKFCTQCGNKLNHTTTTSSTTTAKPTTTTTSSTTSLNKPRPVSTYGGITKTAPIVTSSTSSSSLNVSKQTFSPSKPLPPTTTTTTTTVTPKSILKPTTPVTTTTKTTTSPITKPTTTTTSTVNRIKSHTVNYGKESPIKNELPKPPPKEWSPSSGSGSFVKMAAKSRETLDSQALRDSKILTGQEVVTSTPPPITTTSSKSTLNISHKKAISSPDPISSTPKVILKPTPPLPTPQEKLQSQLDKQAQLERHIQLEKEKFQLKEKEAEKQRLHQIEKDREAEKYRLQQEKEKQLEKEKEKQLELKKQAEREKDKLEKEKQKQLERDKQKQLEKEKQKQLETQKEKERIANQEKLLEKEKEKYLDKERKSEKERERERERERDKLDHEREKIQKEREKLEREKLRQQHNSSPLPSKLSVSSDHTINNNSNNNDENQEPTSISDQIKNILTSPQSSNESSDSPKRKTKHGSRFFSFILGDKDSEEDLDSLQISSPNQPSSSSSTVGNNNSSRESLESSNNSINSENTNVSSEADQDNEGGGPQLRKWAMKRNELQTSHGNLLAAAAAGSNSPTAIGSNNNNSSTTTIGNISPNPSSPSLIMGGSRISSPDPPPKLIELPTATDHRSRVIEEIIITENDYIRDLEIMVWLKKEMLVQDESSKLNSTDEINALFSNVEQLLLVNRELYNTFTDSKYTDLGDAIASGFKMMSAFLKSYFVYCSNQQKALSTYSSLRGKNASYLAYLLTRRECRSLPFDSFLIKPIQRVCKYPLLIRELIKSTPNQSSHDMLLAAQSAIENIVLDVNDKKREFDSQMRMFEIQKRLFEGGQEDYKLLSPSRKLIKEGPITSWGFTVPGQPNTQYNKKPKDGYYYLFNDLFLYTTIKSSITDDNSNTQPLKLKADIALHVSLVKDIPEPSNSFELIFSIQQIWMFSLSSPEEKQTLFTEIDNCIEINLKNEYKKYLEEKQHNNNSSTSNNNNGNITSSVSQPTLTSSPSTNNRQSLPPQQKSSPTLASQVESYDEWRKLVRNKPLPSLPPTNSPSLNRPKTLPPPPPPPSHSSLSDIKI